MDLLESFDVVSLFAMIPVSEVMQELRNLCPEDLTAFCQHLLTTTYFQLNQGFYEQIDIVIMENPFSLVIANLYMENFEKWVTSTAVVKSNMSTIPLSFRFAARQTIRNPKEPRTYHISETNAHKNLNHYPRQRQGVLKTISVRAILVI